MFLNFANFYWSFIQNFSKIIILLNLILKLTRSFILVLKIFNPKINNIGDGSKTNKTVKTWS